MLHRCVFTLDPTVCPHACHATQVLCLLAHGTIQGGRTIEDHRLRTRCLVYPLVAQIDVINNPFSSRRNHDHVRPIRSLIPVEADHTYMHAHSTRLEQWPFRSDCF